MDFHLHKVVFHLPGPILESKSMRVIFQIKGKKGQKKKKNVKNGKKKRKIFKHLGKNVQSLKIFLKRSCDLRAVIV